ncbi:MAG: ATP-dependent zinc metalloprotease FtsH [Eubacteriales bacterium]|nr:ATP-dependent zinc metalloprotease FtsH [Eubacteriales bacterium]MDD3197795.1 ATP-dependent zinc metalloprotease FtsH [Eubacteriales bacterium]MDD3503617.1 ATP-dependent zinc metalloprotease FtsH [Eubacteriales bacterium]MDD4682660.1 ATP-dependent zinc metalloprotease FtsH [Eubacteriales bacterium]
MKTTKRPGGLSFYVVLLAVIIVMSVIMSRMAQPAPIDLSKLISQIENGEVKEVMVNGYSIEVTMNKTDNSAGVVYSKQVSPMWMSDLFSVLKQAQSDGKIESFDYDEPTDVAGWLNIILIIVMVGGMALFIWFTYSRQAGDGKNAMSFGRSRAKLNDPSKNKVTFQDVAGADEEKEELTEVVDFLKNPKKYSELGAKIPRGILLVGSPGTGKTLLAKAVAGEAGVPFFSISGSDFVEMFVGVGASRVRDLFENAKKNAPCIIFIDEIDAVGRHRGAGMGGGHDEREQTLNQLLVEMDGFGPNEGVIVMAATNRPDILDPALLRPGRFDRRITVMRPDIKGREEILKVHAKGKPLDTAIDLKEIAKITPGFTGADLANLLNEAALLAARRGSKNIIYSDISEAVFKIMIGPEKKSRIISEKERKLTAFHEAGHAIVLRNVSETDKVERVSIIPAGGAGGYTAHKPHEDSYYATRSNLIAQIMIALGGRAAEELIFDEISTGASSDLQSCNSIARDMITKYGMSDKLGNLVFGNGDEVFLGKDYGHVQNYSEKLASIIDEEVKKIIDDAYDAVKEILTRQRDLLDALSALLLEKEKIEGPEFEEIFMRYVPDAKPAPGPVPSEAAAEALMQVAEEVEAETESDDSSTAQDQQAEPSNKDSDSRDSDDEVSH